MTNPTQYYAISDPHGYSDKLRALLSTVEARHPGEEVFYYFLGDYIDRGPDSVGVVQIVSNLVAASRAKAILGNHDYKLLRYLLKTTKGEKPTVKLDPIFSHTVSQFQDPDVAFKALVFLESLGTYIKHEDKILVHAYFSNSSKDKPLNKQSKMFYGINDTKQIDERGLPTRIHWWERYDGRNGKVIFGHYHMNNDYDNCSCIDPDVCGTGQLLAYNVNTGERVYV